MGNKEQVGALECLVRPDAYDYQNQNFQNQNKFPPIYILMMVIISWFFCVYLNFYQSENKWFVYFISISIIVMISLFILFQYRCSILKSSALNEYADYLISCSFSEWQLYMITKSHEYDEITKEHVRFCLDHHFGGWSIRKGIVEE